MELNPELAAKLCEYLVVNLLPTYLNTVKSQWDSAITVGTITIAADPIPNFPTRMTHVQITGWDDIVVLDRNTGFPVAYCFATEASDIEPFYQQEDTDQIRVACGIRIVYEDTDPTIVERVVYRMLQACTKMVKNYRFPGDYGYYIDSVMTSFSGVQPSETFIKGGQVSFDIVGAVDYG